MAVAIATTLIKGGSASSATSYLANSAGNPSGSVTYTAGKFYFATFASRTGITADPTQPTASGTGQTWTMIATKGTVVYDNTSSSRKRETTFYFNCTSTQAGVTTTFDEAGQTQTNAEWIIDELPSGLVVTGTNGVDAIVQANNNFDNTAAAATITGTLTSNLTTVNNAVYAVFAEGNGGTFSPGTGFTTVSESHASTSNSLLSEFRQTASAVTDTSASATDSTNSELGVILVELQASVSSTVYQQTSMMLGMGM